MTTQYDKNCASPVLEAQGIVKRFGAFTALGGVDLLIRPGEITALAGPNGAGKTTLFHILNGNLRPDKGRVILNGSDVTGLAPWKMARRGVGRLFQDVRTFPNLSASENIVAALMASGRRSDEAEHWLDLAGLKGKGAVKAERLSFVERKLLAISRLMALDARLLLLDEPAAALPPSETGRVYSFVRRLVEEQRVSVALVEHNIEAIRRFADTVCFLHEGECLKTGSAAEVFSDARVRALYEKDADSDSGQGKVEFVETCDAVRDARGADFADRFVRFPADGSRRHADLAGITVHDLFEKLGDSEMVSLKNNDKGLPKSIVKLISYMNTIEYQMFMEILEQAETRMKESEQYDR